MSTPSTTPATFLTEAMRQQAIGLQSPPAHMQVEQGAIIKFAQAIGDDNPRFNDEAAARKTGHGGLIAPPTFLRSLGQLSPDLPFDLPFHRVLDGSSDWEYFQPVRPGDRITAVAVISDLRERTGRLGLMIISTIVTTYRNQFGEVVATQTNAIIRY